MHNLQETNQKLVLLLTISYFFMELFGGLYYKSIALTTDASFMAINITGQFIAFMLKDLLEDHRINRILSAMRGQKSCQVCLMAY
jgi:Co/Zn/Cd efflux system component